MANPQYIEQTRRFIADLDIPPAPEHLPIVYNPRATAFQDGTQGGAVDSGSLVSFVSGLTETHKSDVLNSTLLAQLAATKKYNRYKQTREWYDFYVSVLANVGWVVPTFVYREYTPSGHSLTVNDAIIKILGAIATGNEMLILIASLNALRDNPNNQDQLTLFDTESFPETSGTFQIMPVGEDDGQVVMAMTAMQFTASRHVTRFLWFSWESAHVELFQSAQKMVLNEDVYGQVRQDVIAKLGDNARKFIHDIEI